MKTIKDLNKIAKIDGLELIKDNGYFYWWGLNAEMEIRCAHLYTTSVYVLHFNRMSFDKWINELNLIKEKIENDNN